MADASAQIRVTVQPEGTCQSQCTRKNTVKILLGLIVAGVLVTLVVVIVAPILSQQHVSKLKENSSVEEKLHEFQTMLAKPTETEMPQPPTTGVDTIKSTVTPTPTTASATTTTSSDTRHTSCAAILTSNKNSQSGVYSIYIQRRLPGRKVWCDMVTQGGGWTIFQRRKDGSLDFNRTWSEYRRGFGSADAEFWLGNDDLHRLTAAQPSELRVDLWDWDGKYGYAQYSTFMVSSASTHYTLRVDGYRGTIGDSLTPVHNYQRFSTADRDNDGYRGNCAAGLGGGWWYDSCDQANLNGRYHTRGEITRRGIHWMHWRNNMYSYKAAAMWTRPYHW